jgi:hypothetical protein
MLGFLRAAVVGLSVLRTYVGAGADMDLLRVRAVCVYLDRRWRRGSIGWNGDLPGVCIGPTMVHDDSWGMMDDLTLIRCVGQILGRRHCGLYAFEGRGDAAFECAGCTWLIRAGTSVAVCAVIRSIGMDELIVLSGPWLEVRRQHPSLGLCLLRLLHTFWRKESAEDSTGSGFGRLGKVVVVVGNDGELTIGFLLGVVGHDGKDE